jgi:hypothetical protein
MRLGRFSGRRPSLYEHIRAHLTEDGLSEGGQTLPDEEEIAADSNTELRWAPGALEGAFSRHVNPEHDETLVADVHSALVELADRPGGRSRARARGVFRRAEARTHVDAVLERLHGYPPRNLDRLYAEVRGIAVESGRREEVKFALAVLGGFGQEQDAELLRTFARHEEFTLYAAIALSKIVSDPVAEWLELARHVEGWGRIELVELLVREPRADACAWLLRGGFRNDVMYGYTAPIVAQHCDLAGTLERESDPELLAGARDILATLADDAWGGPAGGMLDYSEGHAATERYLELVEPRTLDDFLAIDSLRAFLEDDLAWAADEREELVANLADLGWTDEARTALADRCRRILDSPLWGDLVQSELAHEHDELPWQAIQVARRLALPVREFLLSHIEQNAADSSAWFNLVYQADDETLDDALALAGRLYDFDDLAEGPGHELRRKGVFEVADWLLQELIDHPGKGWHIIRPALQSPVVRNRHFALRCLSRWPAESMSTDQHGAVARVADRDPDPEVRQAAERVLRGEPIDPPEMDLPEPEEQDDPRT